MDAIFAVITGVARVTHGTCCERGIGRDDGDQQRRRPLAAKLNKPSAFHVSSLAAQDGTPHSRSMTAGSVSPLRRRCHRSHRLRAVDLNRNLSLHGARCTGRSGKKCIRRTSPVMDPARRCAEDIRSSSAAIFGAAMLLVVIPSFWLFAGFRLWTSATDACHNDSLGSGYV
jgi:hypothetical protein